MYVKTFEQFVNLPNLIERLHKLPTTKVVCYNQLHVDEILMYTVAPRQAPAFFIRQTIDPLLDLEVGFSATMFHNNPYVNTFEEAVTLMSNSKTEDDYHVIRQLKWNKSSDYKSSLLFKHQLEQHNWKPGNNYPVLDKRNGKFMVNPEFGISAYIIQEAADVKHILDNHYMNADTHTWHVFKSAYYHNNDSDSNKEELDNSEYIRCFLQGEYVCPLDNLT